MNRSRIALSAVAAAIAMLAGAAAHAQVPPVVQGPESVADWSALMAVVPMSFVPLPSRSPRKLTSVPAASVAAAPKKVASASGVIS